MLATCLALKKNKINYVISSIHLRPLGKCRISISICCLVSLPMLRHVLEVDVQLLFVNGYIEGDMIL